jgi:hypothetical protein
MAGNALNHILGDVTMKILSSVASVCPLLLSIVLISGCMNAPEKSRSPKLSVDVQFVKRLDCPKTLWVERYEAGRILPGAGSAGGGRPCTKAAGCGDSWEGLDPGQYRVSIQCGQARYFYDATKDTITVAYDSLHATIIGVYPGMFPGDSISVRLIIDPPVRNVPALID